LKHHPEYPICQTISNAQTLITRPLVEAIQAALALSYHPDGAGSPTGKFRKLFWSNYRYKSMRGGGDNLAYYINCTYLIANSIK